MQKYWIKLMILAITCGSFSQAWGATNYYRYKDSDGNTAISTTLPPDVTKQGYEIISGQGMVIKTVPPEATKAEIDQEVQAKQQAEAAAKQAEVKKQEDLQQAHKDAILLKSFSSAADIIRSRDEKIASIAILEEIMRENIIRLQKQLDATKTVVENNERNKQPTSDTVKKTIEETERQIKENQTFLEHKQVEKKEIHATYQKMLDRYNELQPKKQ